jgi:hypothetical protein
MGTTKLREFNTETVGAQLFFLFQSFKISNFNT